MSGFYLISRMEVAANRQGIYPPINRAMFSSGGLRHASGEPPD